MKKKTTLQKHFVAVEEEPDDNGNLEDLPKLVFMDEEWGNLNVAM